MQVITKLPRRIITSIHCRIAATKSSINLMVQYSFDLLLDIIIEILSIFFTPERIWDRLSKEHNQPSGPANIDLYEAIMYPDDKLELVSVHYDMKDGRWNLDAKPTDKQLGRLINREDRVLLLCPRKLVDVLEKGRNQSSMIAVEDAYSKWQMKHVLVNRLSAPGQKNPFGSLPDSGTLVQRGEGRDLRLSSHDIFHIRNLKSFLLHCSEVGISDTTVAGSILKSWMVTMPQMLSILEDKPIMRRCKMAYWELVRRGRVGSTVYLQLHGADDTCESIHDVVSPEPTVQTADTRTIAALRLATGGKKILPNSHSQNQRDQIPTARVPTAYTEGFADQAAHPYGKGIDIHDPQTYFMKFGSVTPPQQSADILMALSFFLRPPELDWENIPLAEADLETPVPKFRKQVPEVFISRRKPDNRMASLSEVTRIAASEVQRQFDANGNNNDVRHASRSFGDTPVQNKLPRTRPVETSCEMDGLQSPYYHQQQRFSLSSPVHTSQAFPDNGTVMGSTETTPKADRYSRKASTETTCTVQNHKQSMDRGTLHGVNGNGAALNPEAPAFVASLNKPSSANLKAEGEEGLSIPTGALPSISLEDTKAAGVPGYEMNGVTHSDSGYNSSNTRQSVNEVASKAFRECSSEASPAGKGVDLSDAEMDLEAGAAEMVESGGCA
ncbi:hypothetical protein VM1G_07473 [Cytospora mali]|uniref:Uncharacterized protein n=1 Tax=Cytospora mali TaxID=578113 RepID=A0A194W6H7_CYTMA|nr:hypothetical protein VM1G_07473 [Valsa mali]